MQQMHIHNSLSSVYKGSVLSVFSNSSHRRRARLDSENKNSLKSIDISLAGSIQSIGVMLKDSMRHGSICSGVTVDSRGRIIGRIPQIDREDRPPNTDSAISLSSNYNISSYHHSKDKDSIAEDGETIPEAMEVSFREEKKLSFWDSVVNYLSIMRDFRFLSLAMSSVLTNMSYMMPVLYAVDHAVENGIAKDEVCSV